MAASTTAIMIQIFKREAALAKEKPVDCLVGTDPWPIRRGIQ
jgi:hypothetical protein